MLNPEKIRPVLGGQYPAKNRGHFERNIQVKHTKTDKTIYF